SPLIPIAKGQVMNKIKSAKPASAPPASPPASPPTSQNTTSQNTASQNTTSQNTASQNAAVSVNVIATVSLIAVVIAIATVIVSVIAVATIPTTHTSANAQSKSLNIYTGRHYPADQNLYNLFQNKTNIHINVLEGQTNALLERLQIEGSQSPADIFITTDAGNLWRAEQLNLLQPVNSHILASKIPPNLQSPNKLWFGFATRYRIAFYNPQQLKNPPSSWDDLANPQYQNQICVRSSSNIYNLSLLASFIHRNGENAAAKWANNVAKNFARKPQGGDTDQLRAAAQGICNIAIANHYYFARLLASDKDADRNVASQLIPLWLGENTSGVHANISGAALLKSAKNKQEAIAFLEFLASNDAQEIFANANYEYPVVKDTPLSPTLKSLGQHHAEKLNVSILGRNQANAQTIYDRARWE
ncbi:MAG: extracellular solute-binding protein, partial [Alphaproteobacteria bacterium]